MKMKLAAVLFIVATPALAQSAQQQQITPTELAINIDSGVNNLAQALTQAQKQLGSDQQQIQTLMKENADLHKQVDAAKKPTASAKPEPPK